MSLTSCKNCSDLTNQLNRIEKKLDSLDLNIKEFNFRLTQDLSGLNQLLKKVDWIKIASLVVSIAGTVASILAVIKIWSQGAYLSKILAASEKAAKLGNDNLYANTVISNRTKEIQDRQIQYQLELERQIREFEYNQNLSNLRFDTLLNQISNFNANFGRATAENFRVIQQEILKIPRQIPGYIKDGVSQLQRQIELIPAKIGNIPAIKQIPNNIKESVREIVREVQKVPGGLSDTITRTIYQPLSTTVSQLPQKIESTVRRVTLQTTKTATSITDLPQLREIAQNLRDLEAGINPLLLIPASVAGLNNKINGLGTQITALPNSPGFGKAIIEATCNSGCSKAAAAQRNNLQAGQDALGNKMDALNATMNTAQLGLLKKIDNTTTKTLSQLGNPLKGGIAGKLQRLGTALSQSPVISWITLLVTLHNAGQLSYSLVTTLGDYLSLGLNTFLFKDSEDQQINVNEVIGQSIEQLIIKIVGQSNWTEFKHELALYNNVYRSAANIVNTVRSMGDSVGAVASLAAENTGKIGNALLKDRVIAENSFPWMSENVSPSSAVLERLNNLDDAANALGMVLSETANVIDAKRELDEQTQKFNENLEAVDPRTRPANKPVQEAQDSSKLESQSDLIDADTSTGIGEIE